jgi:hypothetical protein
MQKKDLVVAICSSHEEANQTLRRIRQSGFDLKNLSIICRDETGRHDPRSRFHLTDRQDMPWAIASGPALLHIPDFGSIAVAGPLLPAIAEELESASSEKGFSALGAGLHNIGIPRVNVPRYETAIKSYNYLVVAHCTATETIRAKQLFEPLSVAELAVHHV